MAVLKSISLTVSILIFLSIVEGKSIHKRDLEATADGDNGTFKDILDSNTNVMEKQDDPSNMRHHLAIDHHDVKLIEGDILIDDGDEHSIKRRVVLRSDSKLWRTRVVPYVLEASLSDLAAQRINQVISDFHNDPTICLTFREKANGETAYLKFKNDGGCYSYIGRTGFDQTVSIGNGCTSYGTVAHEIMHALGFWHEQSRFDRDNYVKIMPENIQTGRESNFDKKPLESSELFSYYDYSSVMHYHKSAFTSNGQPTIQTVPTAVAIGQRSAPSQSDLRAISYLYSCTSPDGIWSEWSPCQYCNQQKSRVCFGLSETACGGNSGIEFHPDSCPCNETPYWQDWGAWSACSATCGQGEKYRNRLCENGIPGNGGCTGTDILIESCNTACNYWGEWTQWSACDVTCGDGSQTRDRDCMNGVAGQGNCIGEATDTRQCSGSACDYWGEWTQWSACDVTCGDGSQTRDRDCMNGVAGQGNCIGEATETMECSGSACDYWGEFGEWSACDVTCGDGRQTRDRDCMNGVAGQGNCIGEGTETRQCSVSACDYWGEFGEWSACDVTCGDGRQTRGRDCMNGVAGQGNCIGEATETRQCSVSACDYWGEFGEWSACDVTCGDGSQTRDRDCMNGAAGQGNCIGEATETRQCSGSACDYWGEWTQWSACDVTCGDGSQTRGRDCMNGIVGQGNCIGEATETRKCLGSACDYWGEWTQWSACDVTCGDGSQTRDRDCMNGVAGQGNCIGEATETRQCLGSACDYWGEWTQWSACDATCGDGSQTRDRDCMNGVAGQGNCIGEATETRKCSGSACDYWGEWTQWSACDVTCGDGSQTRDRDCMNGVAGQGNCIGEATETRKCSGSACDYWGEWTQWSACDVTCGDGSQTRDRDCMNGVASQGNCIGEATETRKCSGSACDYWGEWTQWSACDVTCGDGSQTRDRDCMNGVAGQGNCIGEATETRKCSGSACDYWGEWTQWSACDVTCGDGSQTRDRDCMNGVAGQGNCIGEATETRQCSVSACDYWGEFGEWSACDVTCGDGSQTRDRDCMNGAAGQGNCIGEGTETRQCSGSACDYWGEWTQWSACDVTCGDGSQTRGRDCMNGIVGQGNCIGEATETRKCLGSACDYWGEWTQWSACDVTCGDGSQTRDRDCMNGVAGQGNCIGEATETRQCSGSACDYWGEWTQWSACDATCGDGSQTRDRDCMNGVAGQGNCIGEATETRKCSGSACDYWGEWTQWSACDVTCGDGSQTRDRDCMNGVAGQGNCIGEATETRKCSGSACDYWGEWTQWSACDVTCGDGSQTRDRDCMNGVASQGNCIGEATETRKCSGSACDYWGEWTQWSACDVTCGDGSQIRSRECMNGDVGKGNCRGLEVDTKACSVAGIGEGCNVIQNLFNCDFSNGFCGFRNSKWKRIMDESSESSNMCAAAVMEKLGNRRRFGSFSLTSQTIQSSSSAEMCFSLRYRTDGMSTRKFAVHMYQKKSNGRWRRKKVMLMRTRQKKMWMTMQKTITSPKDFKINISSYIRGKHGYIHLDDVTIKRGKCNPE